MFSFWQKHQDLHIKMERMSSLLNLIQFLYDTLLLTEEVKNVLKSNCEEAMFCLKPWSIEVVSQQKLGTDDCTCPKPASEVEEIAAGISRALLQTQELREKLSSNVVTEKKSGSLRMYECSKKADKGSSKAKDFRISNNGCRQNVKTLNASSEGTNEELQSAVGKRNVNIVNKETKIGHKQWIGQAVKVRQSKNFLEENKRSIKKMIKAKQNKDTNCGLESYSKASNVTTKMIKTNCVKFGEKHSAASMSELKNLIQKISSNPSCSTISNDYNVKCMLHGDIPTPCIYKSNIVNMNLIDSLDQINIPGEIVKSLKVYHLYLNMEYSEKPCNGKAQKAVNKFLSELSKVENAAHEKLRDNNFNGSLLSKFIPLCHLLFSKHLNTSTIAAINAMYVELNPVYEAFKIEKLNNSQILKTDQIEWMTNGIWNADCFRSFEGTSKVCCIRYNKVEQLLLFFDTMQQLQRTRYYTKLIKITLEDVLSYMQGLFVPTQSEYSKMYKMIFILHQCLKTKVPVLVRTDK